MRDAAGDPAPLEPLERLRVQRGRLADRMRLPWWYQSGAAILWALVFAGPFSARYLSPGFPTWAILAAAVAVVCLMQWGLTRATGIKLPFRNLRYRLAGVVAEMACLQAAVRVTRRELRGGGGAA
jgi:hypothetical protein